MKILIFIIISSITGSLYGQNGFGGGEIPDQMYGSMDSLMVKVANQLILPSSCNQEGLVFVEFLLKKNGDTEKFRVIRGLCHYADSVVVQIVKELKFSPRKINNKAVDSKKIFSIPFKKREE